MRDSGIKFSIDNIDHMGFVKGRCASVKINDKVIGIFGELHPKTISNFDLEYPIVAFEVIVDKLQQ
jgi:phenylalanyl-tRNA synthetase beta chain